MVHHLPSWGTKAAEIVPSSSRGSPATVCIAGQTGLAPEPGLDEVVLTSELGWLAPRVSRIVARRDLDRRMVDLEGRHQVVMDRLRWLYDESPAGLVLTTRTRIVTCNASFCEMMGAKSPDELRGQSPFHLYADPEDRNRVLHALRERRQWGPEEVWLQRLDGSRFRGLVYSAADLDDDGELKEIRGSVVDVTERFRLAQERQLILAGIDQAREVVVIVDRSDRVRYSNQAGRRLVGVEAGIDLQAEGVPAQRLREMLSAAPGEPGRARQGRVTLPSPAESPSADPIILEVQVSPIHDGEEVVASVVIASDVSREDELETQVSHLHRGDVTAVLTAGIAHDLRNLLGLVSLSVDLITEELRGSAAGETLAEDLDSIRTATQSGRALTESLLRFARGKEGEAKRVDAADLVRRVAEVLRPAVGRGYRIEVEVGSRVPELNAVPAEVEQILVNLLLNARDAGGGRGTARVTVSGEGQGRSRHLTFVVEDDGPGMDPETLRRVCEAFFTTKKDGNGLGMAVVNTLVRRNGGELKIDSLVGRGTRVEVRFPAA